MQYYDSVLARWSSAQGAGGIPFVANHFWNTDSMTWEPASGGTGGEGEVTVTNFPASFGITGSVAVTGPLTDAQLRATPVPVEATLELSNYALETGGNLASLNSKVTACNTGAVVITSGTITSITNPVAVTQSGSWTISGTTAVSAAALPLPANAAQEAGGNLATIAGKDFATQVTLDLIRAKTDNLDVTLSGGGVHVAVDSSPPASALVSDAVESYVAGDVQNLSMTTDGRLRVATADESYNFAPWGNPERWGNNFSREAISAW